MAYFSIEIRILTNNEKRCKTVVIVKNKGAIIHREAMTFKKKELTRMLEWVKQYAIK